MTLVLRGELLGDRAQFGDIPAASGLPTQVFRLRIDQPLALVTRLVLQYTTTRWYASG